MTKLYIVNKNIRYHHPTHPLGGKFITPQMPEAKEGLPMDHLEKNNPSGLSLLIRKGYLVPKLNIEEPDEKKKK